MRIEIDLPDRYRLISLSTFRTTSCKGWTRQQWNAIVAVDDAGEWGLHWGTGFGDNANAAIEAALRASKEREDRDTDKRVHISGEKFDLYLDIEI